MLRYEYLYQRYSTRAVIVSSPREEATIEFHADRSRRLCDGRGKGHSILLHSYGWTRRSVEVRVYRIVNDVP